MAPQCLSDRVIEAARGWIGTPYHHQMAVKGAGCDCLGLVRGVYAEIYGKPSEEPPPYTPDWGDATGEETMIQAALRHLKPVEFPNPIKPGDVLIFRMRKGRVAKHAAIMSTPAHMIHVFEHGPVCEVTIGRWALKLAAAFRFPELA
jgi:NlpC/P60 family putative phage cell wall peptidase